MKPVKINIHSVVDVITNSSTTVYTWQDNCIQPAKEMIQEFLKVFGIDKKVDDIFYIDSFLEWSYGYGEHKYSCENPFFNGGEWIDLPKDFIEKEIEKVLKKEIDKPAWMKESEEYRNYEGMTQPTSLYILAKEEKYKDLAEKIKKFLNSTDSEAQYN
jgi:hypothetical protein